MVAVSYEPGAAYPQIDALLSHYERNFAAFVNRATTFIEIGVSKGGRQLWKHYLGPFAQIVGIDIDASCKALEEDQISIRTGDQSDPFFCNK